MCKYLVYDRLAQPFKPTQTVFDAANSREARLAYALETETAYDECVAIRLDYLTEKERAKFHV